MSYIDATGALAKIAAWRDALKVGPELLLDVEVGKMQNRAVELVPKRTGNLARILEAPDAVEKKSEQVKNRTRWRFGFLTAEAQRKGFYSVFDEFGTKGYQAGEQRRAGVDKKGRQRVQRVKRTIPARRAQPFMRPAAIEFWKRITTLGLKPMLRAGGKLKVE